ncbi:GNAT family N-acetyltransferase [Polaromonas sp. YR568]|uniref:GNAT family N-acetyltransferase n=1 Tax=Polaromonas sp. YR568 TaxID=1855301 RepID=UPI003137B554
MKGVTFRAFAGPSDFEAMVACANASFAADQSEITRTVEDMARDYSSFTACIPERDVRIAQVGDEIVGYVRGWHWAQADGLHLYGQLGLVAPQWRRQGIGGALQDWLEAHQREIAATHRDATGHAHQSFVNQGETARAALLVKAGYHAERFFFTMVRPTLDAVPAFQLPPGLEIRPVQPEHLQKIWDAHIRAFQTHWGFSAPSEADYQIWLKTRAQHSQLWQIAWDTRSDEVAGQVRAFVDETYNQLHGRKRGWTEFISVGEPWRRRGLARALISRSLHAQKAMGLQDTGLGVDGQNLDGANRVYEDCGFVVTKRNGLYRKPLEISARA